MKAELTSYNQAPRKVRLVTELVKGKKVPEAIAALSFLPKRASEPVRKLIESAVANAKNQGENPDELRIQNITVDSAGMLVRMMPRAMGRGAPIRRRKSRIKVQLAVVVPKAAKAAKVERATPKAQKAPVKKAAKASK